ncbi:dienelactone hydrolase family protein [Vulcaniibacterium tengchongense]|uniref:dienelactone hydrolase family protein n=1 Tax=Vulcaniibacterium tengchongense TaxID=1273429 RepID=UPI001F54B824|nr:dienelactone hydrolase family protein [Vulcaniibacterium tengchongense]
MKPDDKRLSARYAGYASPRGHGTGRGCRVRPAEAAGPLPTALVIHENRGLNPHIEDVARRLALENYIAFAPDALFPLGGYPGDEDRARAGFARLDPAKTRQDPLAAADMLRGVDGGNGRMGAVGFCWGGAMTSFLATRPPDLRAAAPFYGPAPAAEDVPKIEAGLLAVLAENDERVNARPGYEQALKQAGVRYALYPPPGTEHGFHNDTMPRCDADAAKEAWRRTLALFERTLRRA